MVKSKQPFSRYGKNVFLAIFPLEQLKVLNSLRANNYLSQTALDFQKINKNNRMIQSDVISGPLNVYMRLLANGKIRDSPRRRDPS